MSDYWDDCGECEYCADVDDEVESKRGTSECDGLCDPMCKWCLVGHDCPAACAGGECPYEVLAKEEQP